MRSLLVLALASCGGAVAARQPPPPPTAIFGTWALADGSTTVMKVAGAPGALSIDAWATDSKVHFELSGITWDGRRLHATFRYPPTGVTTTSELLLVNADRLEGSVSGAYQARETWLRAAVKESL